MDKEKKQIYIEAGFILVTGIVVFFISGHFDLLEKAFELSRKYEDYELDEVLVTALFLIFALIPLLLRRWIISKRKSDELNEALNTIKQLKALLPICSSCKNIRDENNQWHRIDTYIESHTDTEFTHGICPTCITYIYPNSRRAKRMADAATHDSKE